MRPLFKDDSIFIPFIFFKDHIDRFNWKEFIFRGLSGDWLRSGIKPESFSAVIAVLFIEYRLRWSNSLFLFFYHAGRPCASYRWRYSKQSIYCVFYPLVFFLLSKPQGFIVIANSVANSSILKCAMHVNFSCGHLSVNLVLTSLTTSCTTMNSVCESLNKHTNRPFLKSQSGETRYDTLIENNKWTRLLYRSST